MPRSLGRAPLDYPWDVATTPFVVRADGVAWERTAIDPDALAIVASGSNASPTRLHEKLGARLGGLVVAGVPCVVAGWTPVYSAHFTAYGALPATLVREPEARARLVCLRVPRALVPELHRSEAIGRNYGFFRLDDGGVRVASDDAVVGEPHAYLSLHGVLSLERGPRRLAAFTVDGSTLAAASEREVMTAACRLVAPDLERDALVARLAGDAEFRAIKTAALRRHHARPLDAHGLRRIA